MRLPGLGPKTARRIWKELGITTVEELRAAAEAHRLRDLGGLGAKSEEKILAALAKPRAAEGPRRALLGNVLPRLRAVEAEVAAHPAAVQVSIAGSARRFRETVRDLDLIATATDAPALIAAFCEAPVGRRGGARAATRRRPSSARTASASTSASCRPSPTGTSSSTSPARRTTTSRCARPRCAQGLSVSEYGIAEVETGVVHAFATEEEVYAFLGYEWIPPELRENCGELEAARTGSLPDLVTLADLKGDLHTHTTWSDGKDPLEAMVAEAVRRGYAYYAICDHSHRLRDGRLAQQAEAIDRARRARAGAAPQGSRGEHPRERRGRRRRR